ncbi:unnamed protein product [Oikopleura dioica]|uniref:Uncharacterized protein n=1 Tax=Oikopleura dioica TaxID=34765 RepID=E4XWT7_OIKDI|nr:unnamed protein product [Oikopleura dioica]CBY38163.1 unnamed protein product [Oikopleura dioica]
MKISPLLCGVALARTKGPMWEYEEDGLPSIGKSIRVLSGKSFEIDYLAPSENEESFIFFVAAENIDTSTHKFKSSTNVLVEAMYKISEDYFGSPLSESEIADSEASINRENHKIVLFDHSAGYYFSVLKNKETKKVKTDQIVDVHVAEGCNIKASWDHDIEWEKFGWHAASGSLSFNPVGFNENDVFARCEFPSTPASNLRWKNSAVGDEGLNSIEAKVPAGNTHFSSSFLECELIDKEFAEDQCDVVQTKSQILIPPMKSQYTEDVFADDAHKVWHYVDSSAAYQKVHFTCPLDIYAQTVQVVQGDQYQSQDLKMVSNELPDAAEDFEPETESFFYHETTLDGYEITIDMASQKDGVVEFRCKYENDGNLMGYSQPHVVVKSPEATADIATLEISGSWGAGVANENHVIAVTADSVNVASCSQNAPGYPAQLSIKFKKDEKEYFTPLPGVNKHSISINRDIPREFDETIVSCVAVSGNETKEVELGTLNVMHEPENVKISRTPDQITCSADFSKYDEVTASLSLNRNVLEKMEDGKAIFDLSRFTEAEIAKIDSNGVRCIVTSDNFEGKWESNELSYNILPDVIESIENNPLGFIAMTFIAALLVIGICIYMPANKPATYKKAATAEADDEDPLHSSKSDLA